MAEHRTFNPLVLGSNPRRPTTPDLRKRLTCAGLAESRTSDWSRIGHGARLDGEMATSTSDPNLETTMNRRYQTPAAAIVWCSRSCASDPNRPFWALCAIREMCGSDVPN